MPFLSISFHNFRNLTDSTIDLLSKEVFFIGKNGQGKSNILETLYISAYGSSFRTKSDSELIKNGESDYSIKGYYKNELEKTDSITVSYFENKKKILKNGKTIHDRKDIVNTIPCVLFCHDDLDFSIGEPERRRFFIDQTLSMYDLVYIDTNRKYKRILKTRNLLLKEEKYDLLEAYDYSLAEVGAEIVKKRDRAIFQFNQLFSKLYEQVSDIDSVTLKYDSQWKDLSIDEIIKILFEKRETDKIMKVTMSGPHRDKIKFVRKGKPFISTASTGQRRLTALLLRICQASFYTSITSKKPVLLMDDVLLELDPDKREKVTILLPEYDQLFCTFLPGEPYERYMKHDTKILNVENGVFSERISNSK